MGQLASNQNTRPAGALPTDTEKNPQVNAVTLRNGRELEEVPKKRKDKPILEGELIPKAKHESKKDDASSDPVYLNIPLVDVLREIPKYAKYIKDVVDHKRRLTEFETVALTEECTSRVQNKLPQNLKDPDSFTIPVWIGNIDVGCALYDLGASINLMPLSLFKQLGLGTPRPTTVMLQLADRSIAYSEGVIEDVLLQIGKFIFPADFIILDYEADQQVPIIFGRPLLDIGDVIIKMREVDEQLIDTSVYIDDSLEKALMLFDILEIDDEVEGMMHILDASCAYMQGLNPFEPLNRPSGPPPKPPIEEAPKLELKPCPLTFNMLIWEEKLLRVLHEHKRAIGWTMFGIRGISKAFCMYKILMEEGHKSSIEQQRPLNAIMKEMVDKAKVEAIEILPPQTSVKSIRSFLGYAGFYRRFIKDFSKLSSPLCRLLEKDIPFKFDDACQKAFEELKGRLVIAPIIIASD
ncbi:uncharacterized protein [Nicotiana tomentosiformis]|uniref:uncharacterized protein n=1 Tax=Nicotiana tomentosiformis TaxID=4098 RepID=UPI00388CB1CC